MTDLIDILEGNSASVGIGLGNGNAPVTFGLDQNGSLDFKIAPFFDHVKANEGGY